MWTVNGSVSFEVGWLSQKNSTDVLTVTSAESEVVSTHLAFEKHDLETGIRLELTHVIRNATTQQGGYDFLLVSTGSIVLDRRRSLTPQC